MPAPPAVDGAYQASTNVLNYPSMVANVNYDLQYSCNNGSDWYTFASVENPKGKATSVKATNTILGVTLNKFNEFKLNIAQVEDLGYRVVNSDGSPAIK